MKKYTLQELRTPGTPICELKDIKVGTNTSKSELDFSLSFNIGVGRVSYGSTTILGEEMILIDYKGLKVTDLLYAVPISEFRRLGLLDEFVLPEKWFVHPRTEENLRIIKTWKGLKEDYSSYVISNFENAYTSKGYYWYKSSCEDTTGYKEITFEQFLQYVLKENTMKKIIRYVFNKDNNYKEAIHKICGSNIWTKFPILELNSSYFNTIKEAGVLNLWFTPVYEEDKVRKIGKYDVVFNTPNIKVGCTW